MGAFNRFHLSAVALPVLAFALTMPAAAEPVPRSGAAAGAVIARKVGEEVRFIDVSNWQTVDLKQDLISGDILRTNETGQLAILFSDRTQVRLGRNSSLVVKQVTSSTDADTVLQLQSGTIWARAERGGPGVKVETAAAAAAIRGTDWTMTVNGAHTSLTVLEGLVSLSNPQGSVEVRQGEGAAATIGQAPRKIAIVESDDREQMLFYLPPREAFRRMPPSAEPVAAMRINADRIAMMPAVSRSAEDWLTLAEAQLSLEGRAKATETLARLRAKALSSAQQARVILIEAILAASDAQYAEAAQLFAKAEKRLDAKRRGIALYGGYYARSLADPNRAEALPKSAAGSDSAFLRAYAVGFLKDLRAAIDVLREAEKQYPDDPGLPAYRAWMALLLNDRRQLEDAVKRSLALDPREPTALEVQAYYKSGIKGDLKGAIADVKTAIEVTPGSSSAWNTLGVLQSDLGANREAEASLQRAAELDPGDPVAHANLAIFYLELNRMKEAKREIDLALVRDPALSVALMARGRYYMQTGETDKAVEDLLAATVSDPSIASGQLLLSGAYYHKGDRVAGAQAADNADRLDNNDPAISALRASVAIDSYDSEGAIRHAQEYVRRSRARGGEYSSLGANQAAGSTLNDAFRFQGMNSWAEYYSDASFDPLVGMAYIDQGIRGSANPFANSFDYGNDIVNNIGNAQSFSSILQGLMLEPQLISGKTRGFNLLPQPFIEGSIGGGFTASRGDVGYIGEGDVQAYSNEPFPVSFLGSMQWEKIPQSRDLELLTVGTESRPISGTAYLTASPTPYDRVVVYYSRSDTDFNRNLLEDDRLGSFSNNNLESSSITSSGGIGWSHTAGYENVINAALLFNAVSTKSSEYRDLAVIGIPIFALEENKKITQDTYIAAINHTLGAGDLTWRYGIEGGWVDATNSTGLTVFFPAAPPAAPLSVSDRTSVARAYVDLLHEITPGLKAEYALFGSYMESDGLDMSRLEPRVGIAWSPAEGHWLRAGFMRNSFDLSTPTLSPVGIVGLQQNQVSIDPGGLVDTVALRWDAEWTPSIFTAWEFQHQDIKDASIPLPLVADTFDTRRATIDRISLSSNIVLGQGLGLASSIAYTDADDRGIAPAARGQLPYVPEWGGQVALTWVNPANIKTTIAANYVGDRVGRTGLKLDDYWTLDAALTWEPFDKRFELELAAYNLLDKEIRIDANLPGWGRSFKGTLKVRF